MLVGTEKVAMLAENTPARHHVIRNAALFLGEKVAGEKDTVTYLFR